MSDYDDELIEENLDFPIEAEVDESSEQIVLESVGTVNNEEDSNANDESNKKPVKTKRVVRNPQPKLNAERLKSKRGLEALESYFDRVKFKGRGHEEEDLAIILKTYEYWCHRLFPKYPFDECIDKIEKLGNKRPVVTHIKKIRAGLLFNDEPSSNTGENEQDDNCIVIERPDTSEISLEERINELTEEQLERIMANKERAERIRREKQQQRDSLNESSLPMSQNSLQNISYTENMIIEKENEGQSTYVEIKTSENLLASSTQSSLDLTEEQIERIRVNKERAHRILEKKLQLSENLNDVPSGQGSQSSSENVTFSMLDTNFIDSNAEMGSQASIDEQSKQSEEDNLMESNDQNIVEESVQ